MLVRWLSTVLGSLSISLAMSSVVYSRAARASICLRLGVRYTRFKLFTVRRILLPTVTHLSVSFLTIGLILMKPWITLPKNRSEQPLIILAKVARWKIPGSCEYNFHLTNIKRMSEKFSHT